jgi:hypothetical protein
MYGRLYEVNFIGKSKGKLKGEGKFVPMHAMKAYMGSRNSCTYSLPQR